MVPLTRREFVTRVAICSGAISLVRRLDAAQQTPRVRRIGLAFGDDPEGGVAAFREELRRLGHYLTLNTAAAKTLGLTFPPALLSQADRVVPQP